MRKTLESQLFSAIATDSGAYLPPKNIRKGCPAFDASEQLFCDAEKPSKNYLAHKNFY